MDSYILEKLQEKVNKTEVAMLQMGTEIKNLHLEIEKLQKYSIDLQGQIKSMQAEENEVPMIFMKDQTGRPFSKVLTREEVENGHSGNQ